MTCREKNKIVSRSVLRKIFHRLSVFKFYSSELVMFKMYPRNQNQSLRKLAVERRRAKASGSRSIYVTLHWSTTLSETIEINRNISLSVSFVIFRIYCHSMDRNNRKNRNLNGPLLDFQIWLVRSQFWFS